MITGLDDISSLLVVNIVLLTLIVCKSCSSVIIIYKIYLHLFYILVKPF